MFGQGQGAEKRRRHPERMDGRTDVMHKAGERQGGGARPTADGVLGLVDPHRTPGARQGNGRSQTIGTGTDHNGIVGSVWRHSATSCTTGTVFTREDAPTEEPRTAHWLSCCYG